jgi:hypothetical protein
MPVYRNIDDFTAGDSYTLIRSMDILNSGALIQDGWLTVKNYTSDNDSMALMNLHITGSGTSNGYINNYPDGTSRLYFTIVPTDSQLLQPLQTYYYDICIRSAADEKFTVEEGKFFTTRYVRHVLA